MTRTGFARIGRAPRCNGERRRNLTTWFKRHSVSTLGLPRRFGFAAHVHGFLT